MNLKFSSFHSTFIGYLNCSQLLNIGHAKTVDVEINLHGNNERAK